MGTGDSPPARNNLRLVVRQNSEGSESWTCWLFRQGGDPRRRGGQGWRLLLGDESGEVAGSSLVQSGR